MNILRRCCELARRSVHVLSAGAALCGLAVGVNSALLSSAAAYIDPGTGTMIIQVLGALIASALFYLRSIRVWLADKLGLSRNEEADHGPEQDRPDEVHARRD